MPKLLVPVLVTAALLLACGACARDKNKSSARVYAGDAPSIKYSDRAEIPGGHIQAY